MKLFAVGDLHLPGGQEKPMDIFGDGWLHHFDQIAASWRAQVTTEDAVLIPGDISWAMHLSQALPDLEAIGALPGRKVILRGNHDYWWSSITQIRSKMPPGMMAIQHDAVDLGDVVVCGTRGWMFSSDEFVLSDEDMRICQREQLRLKMSLEAAMGMLRGRPLVVMMHYPPLLNQVMDTCYTAILAQYPVRCVVYGHLHGAGIRSAFQGDHRGVAYQLVSCDALGFQVAPVVLPEK